MKEKNSMGNKISIVERFKNIKAKLDKLTYSEIQIYKYITIMAIFVDMFGLYWYLKLKSFALALIIVLMIVLAGLFFLERDKPKPKVTKEVPKPKKSNSNKKEDKKMPEEKDENESEEKSQDFSLGDFDMGLGSAEEYNERAKRAFQFTF